MNTRRTQRNHPSLAKAVATCLEPLERRALMSATINVNDINAETPSHIVEVRFSDPDGINKSTIDGSELVVSGPKTVNVTLVRVDDISAEAGTDYMGIYALAGPGGSWDSTDEGGYAITVAANSVTDQLGNNLDSGDTKSFDVNIPPPPETNPPTATISAGNVTSAGGTTHSISVTYTDETGINTSSIGTDDITVARGDTALNVVQTEISGSGNSRTVKYTFTALGGSWDQSDNGDYTVTVNAGAVIDTSINQNGSAAASGSFTVAVPPPPDTTAPTGTISVGALTAASQTHNVTVTYSDDRGINLSTISANDIDVTGGVTVTGAAPLANADRTSVSVTYTLTGPGGSFDASDNGLYTVSLKNGEVKDDAGNNATASAATFAVGILALPIDIIGPTATIANIGTVSAGGASFEITVTYSDETAMDAGSITADDLLVSKAGAGGDLTVSSVSKQVSADGKSVTATYVIAAPGGTLDASDNGDYSVSVRAGQVRDAAGNASQVSSQNFTIGIGAADANAPTGVISTGDVTTPGTSHTITVVYTDDTGINAGTIGAADIRVAAPGGGTLVVTDVAKSVSNDGKTVTATYTVAAPGGSWDSADNGTYTVTLNNNAVRDTAGNAATAAAASFNVSLIAGPSDDSGPLAVITAPDISAAGGSTQTVTVVYTDTDKVRANTIGVGDLVVTKGGAALEVTGVTTTSSNGGTTITATYTLAAPGGSWDAADAGTYSITLTAGAVADNKGNGNAVAGGSFNVNLSANDTANPVVASITAGDVTVDGVKSQTILVTYTDDSGLDFTTIGTDDITVTGPGGTLVASVASVAASADGKSAVVTYIFAAPGDAFTSENNGSYQITLQAGAVKDAAGKGVAAATASFNVNIAIPTPIDPGFGSGSPVMTGFVAESVAASASGKVIVVGRSGGKAVIEVRNSDGTLDTSFNKTGQLTSSTDLAYYAVVAQGDKIIVAGTRGDDMIVVRYTADGKIDSSFGVGGRMQLDFGSASESAYAMTLSADGKVVIVGESNGNFAVARLTADGRLDTTFDADGMTMFDLGGVDLAGAVAVQPDGKIVVAGTSGSQVVVARIQENGLQDSTEFGSNSAFSGDGMLIITGLVARSENTDRSTALAIQADGKILIGNHTTGGDFGVVRVDTNGNIDSSFGSDGMATADFGGNDDADALVLQPTGEILAVGTSLNGSTGKTTLAAFNSSGQLIEAFGEGGKLTLDNEVSDPARELHVGDLVLRAFGTRQADGRVVVGTTNSAPQLPQQQSRSAFQRVAVPGSRSTALGMQVATFGVINGKNTKGEYTDLDGTKVTFSIKKGTGIAYITADGKFNLVLTDDGGGCTVAIKGKGGDGRITFGDVTVSGALKSMAVKNGDLVGTFSTSGEIGKLTLGDITNASITAAGNIGTITASNLVKSKLLAGANLGTNSEFGGTGANADSYGGATIGSLKVSGRIEGSTIGAGLDPVDATFLDEDDRVIGGAASFIKAISARSADDASRFLSGSFGKVKLGTKVEAESDPRFRVLQ